LIPQEFSGALAVIIPIILWILIPLRQIHIYV
jgi:type IV secretory pathway component VirB8